ncbi:DUF4465 domain-containing protein [Pontiellaceae bacterium B12219]|nr:DUF4465 domain-containing protein [Pontiellaceae bacterium B12219]
MMKRTLLAAAVLAGGFAHASLVDFDAMETGPNGYFLPATDGSHDWTDNGATFDLDVSWGGSTWNGFTYSAVNDTTTASYLNQYAVYGDGKDKSGSGVYAVSYVPLDWTSAYDPMPQSVGFGTAVSVDGFHVNNTTYTALSMLNGDGFAKAFGGTSGDDADWFKLTVEGFDGASASQGVVDFYLADYRFADNTQDYVVDDWTWVDLSGLGDNVASLSFSLSSSDVGDYGMNTPGYFAIDELSYEVVPEPGTITLMVAGFGGILFCRRRRKYFMK